MGPFNSKGTAPPCCPHHAPHPQHKHSGPCDICSGHHRAIFPLPWQLAEQARPLTASGGGRKGPQCQVARPAAPPVSSGQWCRAMSAVTRGGHRDPPHPPLKLCALHCWDGAEVKVIHFCLMREAWEGQSRVGSAEWAGLPLHLELLRAGVFCSIWI